MKKIFFIKFFILSFVISFSQINFNTNELPLQSGNSGKFLTTNGSVPSWTTVSTGISGSGTNSFVPLWNGATSLTNSIIYSNSTSISVANTESPNLLNVYHTRSATGKTTDIDAINLGGHYSTVAGSYPKLKLYDDGGSVAGIGVSLGQIDYIGYNTAVNHVFYSGSNRIMTIVGSGEVGIYPINTPTSFLHLPAPSGTKASLRLEQGSPNSSPNNGDIYTDGTHIYCYLAGTWKQLDN